MFFILPPTLIVDGQVIGSREGGRWREAKIGASGWGRRTGGTFREIGVGRLGSARVVKGFEEETDGYAGVFAKPHPPFGRVLFGGGGAKVPRKVVELNPANAIYRRVVRSFLARKGVLVPNARVTRLIRTDLDGDGSEEILLAASSRGDFARTPLNDRLRAGEYSLLLLRTVRAGKVVEIPLSFAAKGVGFPEDFALRAIADLDGDGRMEVVVSSAGWESSGAALWGFRSGRATRLVENGSGL